MSLRLWEESLPRCVGKLPGCPEFLIIDALRDAAIEFMERSRIWTVEAVTLATTIAGQRDYDVTVLPEDTGLTHIHVAWVGDREVPVIRAGTTHEAHPTETDDEYGLLLLGRDSLRLSPAPSVAGEVIKATVSYMPTETSPGIENELYTRWREAIEKRAIAELQQDTGQPWSSAQWTLHMERFDKLLNEAANEAGPVSRNPLRVRMWG